jgi:O-antigen/teichoic acid export membrane protein
LAILSRAYSGIAWSTGAGALQMVIRLTTFTLVASRLAPSEIGAFAIATMFCAFAEVLTATPFGESLQQRKSIRRAHLNATFLSVLVLTISGAIVLASLAPIIAGSFSSPDAAILLQVLAAFIPLSSISVINDAILIRRMRFDTLARSGASGAAVSGVVAISGMLLGAGIWSLVAADIASRIYQLVYVWRAARYVPGGRTNRAAFTDLFRFNMNSVLTYLTGFLDNAAPRALTGYLLGPAALGYLVIAQKFTALLGSLVLTPIAGVTMASVARLHSNPAERKALVLSLYRFAALVAYPAFLGAALIVPDVAGLLGDKWAASVLIAQILLIRGIRLTTGAFNVGILRGAGHSGAPLVLLGSGLILNLLLIPPAAAFGLTGIALAMLARTLLTWPVGVVFIRRATEISAKAQVMAGTRCLIFALIMAVAVGAGQHFWTGGEHALRALIAVVSGAFIYGSLLALGSTSNLIEAARFLRAGQRGVAFRHLRQALGF